MEPIYENLWDGFLPSYCNKHPAMTLQDIEKLLYQSTFGCRHQMLQSRQAEQEIRSELEQLQDVEVLQPLPGTYVRVHLRYLVQTGLSPATLAGLFCCSARQAEGSTAALEWKLGRVLELCRAGKLPFSEEEAREQFARWKAAGYPAVHHSEVYRNAYHPAYRVIAAGYARLLPLLAELERQLRSKKQVILAIEGGSGSGKSTLAGLLQELYGAAVVHMDDFFLRPEQRTPERYAQPGGNVDWERFEAQVLQPLQRGDREIFYHIFDCHTFRMKGPVLLERRPVMVVEGSYSMHPRLEPYYDLSVFLQVPQPIRMERILHRNGAQQAQIFAQRWIPLENAYFDGTKAAQRCSFLVEEDREGDPCPGETDLLGQPPGKKLT